MSRDEVEWKEKFKEAVESWRWVRNLYGNRELKDLYRIRAMDALRNYRYWRSKP